MQDILGLAVTDQVAALGLLKTHVSHPGLHSGA